eukprot:m.537673 g.537673  ORF g.537673 m.537673 type:complete len:234 (+) comp22077_c0_seq26:2744-3445(+)
MTELLLSDVTEKHERLQQAWVIPEQDVIFEEMLASGAFGTVWKGRWGHIPVAVKKLKLPLDGLDPVATEDFDREVSFMQSIRHPNLLIFYGAGVTSDGLAFLVVELMVGGSLRTLLHNLACTLTWEDKFRFALDTARGMKHLHVLNTIHRDLKSDNCLVDEHLRVKVRVHATAQHVLLHCRCPPYVYALPLPTICLCTASAHHISMHCHCALPLLLGGYGSNHTSLNHMLAMP